LNWIHFGRLEWYCSYIFDLQWLNNCDIYYDMYMGHINGRNYFFKIKLMKKRIWSVVAALEFF